MDRSTHSLCGNMIAPVTKIEKNGQCFSVCLCYWCALPIKDELNDQMKRLAFVDAVFILFCFLMYHPIVFRFYAYLWKAGWFSRVHWTYQMTLDYHVMAKHHEIQRYIFTPLHPSVIFSPSHTQKWPLVSFPQHLVTPSGAKSLLLHSGFTAWLNFPPTTRRLSNVTDTALKQHCHSLPPSSIFSHWHFPFCVEQQVKKETREGIFSLLFFSLQGGKKQSRGFVLLIKTRSGLSLLGVDGHNMVIQVALQSATPSR